MFSNLKAKKRITQLLIAVLVVALTATGSALLLNDFIQEAKAADYTVNNPTDWSNAVTSGGTVNITIGQSFDVSGRLTAIPAGTTVNLYMNGKTIRWYNASSGNTGIMSTSYPLSEGYWGIITNNGTLNITGSGTIASYQVGWNTKNGSGRDNYGMRTATIVNNGTLDVGSGITVKAFGGQANTDGNSYQDMVIYALGIYNTGTVTSSGTIHAGTIAQGVSAGSTGSNSYVSAYSYGIFGGNVTVTGGNIYSEAMSGLHENVTIPKQENRVGNFAVGVYSNNATIYGNAKITTKAISWRDNDSNYNTWKNGMNISWGVGVMYSGSNYPYIGADVNIDASYQLVNGSTVSFPSLNNETVLCSYTRHSSNGPSSYSRKAYPVAGVTSGLNAAMYGGQTGEAMEIDGNKVYGVGTNAIPSAYYRSELAAYNGLSDTVSVSNYGSATGSNDIETKTGYITNGAPGNKVGGQYMVYYRYRDTSGKIIAASPTPNTAINSRMVFSPANGVFTSGGTALTKSSGGDVVNPNAYEFVGTYHRSFNDGGYGTGIDCTKVTSPSVSTQGTSFTTTLTMTENQIYVIWVDYKAKPATNIKVVAANTGNEINKLTTSTSFTTEYTGNVIVPGTDFNLGVIDMLNDYDINSDNLEDNTVITGNYAISGNAAGKIPLTYSYSTDGGVTFDNNGLPKDVGSYIIRVVVPADKDRNRNGGTFDITGTITAATPTISGASTQTGTYGSTIAELIPTSEYTAKGKGGIELSGSWSYVGYSATDYLEVGTGSKTVTLKWTPDEANKKNYVEKTLDVTVSLSKRAVTVAPADSTVNYGAKTPSYALNYTNIATCDESSKASWLANTTFEVYYNGSWQPYASTMIPGTYDMRIASFGGDTANNNFTTNGVAKLTINKAPLYYTATTENKVYDGVASVNVTLTYAAGAVNGDSFAESLTTTGTLTTADAGENKEVKVVTTGLSFPNSEKYTIAIQNNPTVTVSKATPTASAEALSFEYDSNRTLNNVEINGTASVTGSWSWKGDADKITPTVDVTSYTAIFTPVNTTNYNTVEVPVAINVSKKVVTVSVADKNISYGDPAPALPLIYTGFTGVDTIDTVATTGSIAAESAYSMGKSVGTYPITITMTDYEADNYEFVAATDCVVNVAKKNITVTAPSGTLTYGDNDIEYDVDDLSVAADALYGADTLVLLNDEANFVITTEYERGDGVGSYEVTVSASETTNYTFTFVKGYTTVNKASLTITANNAETTYGLVAPEFTFTATGYIFDSDAAALSGKPTITSNYNKNAGDGAGQYQITVTQGTLAHPNYTFKLVNGTLTVKKATPSDDTALIFATIIHDGVYADAIFTDTAFGGVTGTFALKDKNAIADYTAAEFEGDVNGEWSKYTQVTGIFTPSDSDNYNSVETTVYLVIMPHAITGSPVITGTAMGGATISASVAGMAPSNADSYTYIWYVAGTAAGTGASYTVKAADIGKAIYVEVKAVEDKGYIGTAKSASVTAVESFAQLVGVDQLDIIGANATYVYDDNAHGATVTVKNEYKGLVSENITVYYNGSTAEPYKAGTYIVTIDVGTPTVPAGANRDNYYGPVSGLQIGTITIEKKAITATFTVADKIYDGTRKVNEYNVLTNGVIEPNDVRLDVSAISIAFAKANAGNQSIEISGVKLVGEDAANYVLEIAPASAVITPATLTATVTGVTRPYNGSATVNVSFANITGYAAIDSSATVYFAQATATATSPNAGTQGITNIRYELGGTSAGNYIVEITNLATATVTITKATPSVTAPTVSGLVYDANRTLANIVLSDYYVPDSNGYWQFDDTSVTPTVKKTAYDATYVSQNANYADLKTTITVNVTPKEVTLYAQNTTVSYGKAASFSVTADGFTGSDSLATMGGTQPTYVCSYYVGQPVGKYTIGINHNLDSNGNYTFKTVGATLTVVPADLYVSATATDRDYNGSTGVEVKFAITSGKYANDDVSLSTTTANGIASSANAGTRTVTYTAPTLTSSNSKASNYNIILTPASGILTVTINKLNPEGYVFPKTATIEFGQALSWAQFSDDAQGDGTFALVGDVPNALGEYAYEVVFTPADSVNYNKVTDYVRLTVVTCTVSYQVAIGGTAQVGERLSTVFTGLPSKAYEHIKYQWYRVSDGVPVAINGANASTYSPVEADVGCAIVCVTYFDNTAPFQISEDIVEEFGAYTGVYCETDDSIEEENLTFWQRLVKWIQSIIEALTGLMFVMG